MYRIFIVDTAVSLVPVKWLIHKQVKEYQSKYNRLPLINASYHQKLLKNIKREERKDRPDILHFGLLTILGYSKFISNLEIYFTLGEKLYIIDNNTRIPRDQYRFYGIIETIFNNSYKGNFIRETELPQNFDREKKLIFTKNGAKQNITSTGIINLIFGGFGFGTITTKFSNSKYISLSDDSLELWTALSLSINQFLRI